MTQCKYVSVYEYTSGRREGERFATPGKVKSSGKHMKMSTPDNDVDGLFHKMEWERVAVFDLPEPMSKQEVKDWLQEEEPDEVYEALRGGDNDGE